MKLTIESNQVEKGENTISLPSSVEVKNVVIDGYGKIHIITMGDHTEECIKRSFTLVPSNASILQDMGVEWAYCGSAFYGTHLSHVIERIN